MTAALPVTLTPRVVETYSDVLLLRTIRNHPEVRRWMTSQTEPISRGDHLAWWTGWPAALRRVFLYGDAAGVTVGFGMVRTDSGIWRWWVTLGLLPAYRGRGYGTAIYRHLAAAVPDVDLWAEIRADNEPSIRAALAAGYCPTGAAGEGETARVLLCRRGV